MTPRMSDAEMKEALVEHLERIRAIGREIGISPERMGWEGAQWPLWCVIREIETRIREVKGRAM